MFRIGFLFLASVAAPAFAALGAQTSRQLQTTSVVDLAVATPSLSTLATVVTTAELAEALSDPEANLTDNGAFGALPFDLLDSLLTPVFKKHLTEILFYDVFADGAVLSSAPAATQDITMLDGEILTVTRTDTTVTVATTAGQTATVITIIVEGSNGAVHIIDGVLLPSSIGATVNEGYNPGQPITKQLKKIIDEHEGYRAKFSGTIQTVSSQGIPELEPIKTLEQDYFYIDALATWIPEIRVWRWDGKPMHECTVYLRVVQFLLTSEERIGKDYQEQVDDLNKKIHDTLVGKDFAKGEMCSYFQFGDSDCVMLFERKANVDVTAKVKVLYPIRSQFGVSNINE
jgi:uncharacterized surface protein with fasciclin (FAS1) repeats